MPASALDAATDVLRRARTLLELDIGIGLDGVREDVWRTALALGVAALDTYMHWAIRSVSLASPLPAGLAQVSVDFGDMLAIADGVVTARKAGLKNRPTVSARHVLNEKLLMMTFQTPQGIERGLNMLGITGCWTKLGKAMQPPAQPRDLRRQLAVLAHRRNQIVHEGDLVRLQRPQTVRRQAIKLAEVKAGLDWLDAFIAALSEVQAEHEASGRVPSSHLPSFLG